MKKTKLYEVVLKNNLHLRGAIVRTSGKGMLFDEIAPVSDLVFLSWEEIRILVPVNNISAMQA